MHSEAVPGHPVQLQFAPKTAAKAALGRRTKLPLAVPVDYLGLVSVVLTMTPPVVADSEAWTTHLTTPARAAGSVRNLLEAA